MEDLLMKQAETTAAMEKLLVNFKKEKTGSKPTVVGKKIEKLEELFRDFHANHLILSRYEDKTHEYFRGEHFKSTETFYYEALAYLEKYVTAEKLEQTFAGLREQTSGTSKESPNIDKKLDEKLRKQAANYKAFQRTLSNIDVETITEKWEFEDALKTLEGRWTTIDTLHWELQGELSEGDNEQFETLFNNYEKKYTMLKKSLNSKMWSETHRDKTTPKMEVPVFHGNYNQWVSFKDLFTETIHKNSSLSNAQKMQFLKGKVRGEAERLIQHLNISSDNYTVSWDILTHRYNNKRLIFSTYINTLLELPNMKNQSLEQIKTMHDVAQETLNAIKNLGVDVTAWDPLIVHILDLKLDGESHSEYIDSLKDRRELPVMRDFIEFLEGKFTALETVRRKGENNQQRTYNNQNNQQGPSTSSGNNRLTYNYNKERPPLVTKSTFNVTSIKCPLCNYAHGLYNCKQFLELRDDLKLKKIRELRVCINCLFSHNGGECKSTKTCRKCNLRHSTIIHDALSSNNHSHVSQHRDPSPTGEVLLSTALVKVKGGDGTYQTLRALIDQGSQVSIITEKAAQLLKIKRINCKGSVFGVGEKEANGKGMMNIECKSIHNDYTFNTHVIIMNNLVGNLPNKTFNKPKWTSIQNISLADPEFYISRPVDVLLGADIYSQIILSGIIKANDSHEPVVQQTHLGWLLCGSAKTYKCNIILHELDEIKKFWELEEINEQSNLTVDEQHCITYYNETTNRKEDGRYEVRLPLKEDIETKLGSSKQVALAQFKNLEKKFERQNKLAADYKTFMEEYRALNHMHPTNSNETPEYYMPHHGVERIDSLTTQYRVVFNASNKTSTGWSLNDLMYTGPNLQVDLQTLLLRWRQYQHVFTADIEKMFRMILVNEADQKYQKIIWRSDPGQPIQTFCLSTVSYGQRSAPFLAMMTLRKLAADSREQYPKAAEVAESSFYMDDLLHGSDTIEEGKQLIKELDLMMKSGGFNLRKWSASDPELLQNIKEERNKTGDTVFNFKTDNISKTLGLCWNSDKDTFTFQYNIPEKREKQTKRSLLSEISRLFDPMGYMAPLITKLKLLFQQLWKEKISWDDEISDNIKREWSKLKAELIIINEYEIPRWINSKKGDVVELHGFCDSSLDAFACVVYAKISNKQKVVLVSAKTKLVPHKKATTLPRLEMNGAHLLSKLMRKIADALQQYKLEIYGWTDSMVVLGWLQGEPGRWKPYVANRVQKTTEVIPSQSWRYVKSNENPADAASRGQYPSQLKENILWREGPKWLSTFEKENTETKKYVTDEETRRKHTTVAKEKEQHLIDDLLNKHSSFNKITRIVAWLLRTAAPNNRKQLPSYLTLHELAQVKTLIVKHVQQTEYGAEIEQLRKSGYVESKSNILNLNPYIDELGVLRVGGRLENANINKERKHPKIIPRGSRLAELLIDEAHKLTFHGGPRVTSANLRQQYWIPGGNNAVKKQLRNCVTCRKNTPNIQKQLMGELPAARVEPAQIFFHCGVDYTGFVEIKANKTRNARSLKGYIAVFICMVTKAVHLELVSDLTSSAFLAALRRMSARRGAPRHMYSDCGTNFVGANRALQEEYEQVKQTFDDKFMGVLAEMNVTWHFNAPAWPSAGGIWERAVRSLKHHLRRVVGDQRLTFEEYSTILSQVEACLNSRPLCALTEDVEDLDFLTPAHFLTGRAGVTVIETREDARTRWFLTKQIVQQTWKRWKDEYLSQLTARSKWLQPKRNIQVGDLVTIQDDNMPVGKWAMARVVELHPGRDGYVRVVTLKTVNGYVKRPIVKLSLLPIQSKKQENKDKGDEKDEGTPNKPQQTNCSRKQRPKLFAVVMAILFFNTITSGASATSNITQLNINQSLYFDPLAKMQLLRDQWTLVTYYDMSPYWDGTKATEKILHYLENICNSMGGNNKCNMILPQLIHQFNELKYYDQLLSTQHFTEHARRRRGLINGVGYIANSLFGVLDQHFAEQYSRDIALIQQNQSHLKNLWNNQTSVLEAEHNLLKRTEEIMEKQHKAINKHLNSLDDATKSLLKEANNAQKEQDMTMTAIVATNILQNLKEIQKMMLDTISDIFQGQFNLHLLTPKQLQEQLNIITGMLSSELTLPIENIHTDITKLYKLLKIRARMTQTYFIFEIRIPLVSREAYDLYHVIPLPKVQQRNMITITPISEYVALNLQKDSYISVTKEDIQKCIIEDSSTYMCNPQNPIYKMKSDQDLCVQTENRCETVIAECKNNWIGLMNENIYLYFCCEQCQLRTICEDRVTAHQLMHTNVISLDDNCVIKTNEFTIYGHKHHRSQINIKKEYQPAIIAPINHIINITIEKEDGDEMNETARERNRLSEEIEAKLKLMKDNQSYEDEVKVSYHDIHHYTLIYGILAIMVLMALAWIWRRSRHSWRAPQAQTAEAEMTSEPAVAGARQPAPLHYTRHRYSAPVNVSDSEIELNVFKSDKVQTPVFRKIVFSDE